MKCPSCAAPSSDEAAECPACGLIFAKWRERREKEKRTAAEALALLDAAPSAPAANPWIARGAAAAFVAAWLLFLWLYVRRHPAKPRQALGAPTGQTVEVRDPRTGAMRRMPILRMPGSPVPTASPPVSPAAEPVQ